MNLRFVFGAIFVVAFAPTLATQWGCTLILNPDASQCRSDADCAQFLGASCDKARNLCVPKRGDNPAMFPNIPSSVDSGAKLDSSSELPGRTEAGVEIAADGGVSVRCSKPNKPLVTIEGDITTSDVLSCDRQYLLIGTVFVKSGAALTIEAGTTIRGDKLTKGTLVVQPGARIHALGTRDMPIVFTSNLEGDNRQPGDWGGIILLGRAPVNELRPNIEGLLEGGQYGGTDPTDSSGTLRYVRIEYSGTKIGPNNEINGLTLGGVGEGTFIDFIQVRLTADDCFEFFGGTVNAKHLVCQKNGDDGFDWDLGYKGKLQFLVLQQDPEVNDETNGFEGDNDATGSLNLPTSEPKIYNATLCGKGRDVEKQQYGLLLRRSTRGTFRNLLVSGFEAGLDIRDANTMVDVASSNFFGNGLKNFAYEEDQSASDVQKDDDGGFDELAWLNQPARKISAKDPGIDCFNQGSLQMSPKNALTEGAEAPPKDGFFDNTATFIGAFRDQTDTWASGAWVVWQPR